MFELFELPVRNGRTSLEKNDLNNTIICYENAFDGIYHLLCGQSIMKIHLLEVWHIKMTMTEFDYSFEIFICPEKDFFSGSRDDTLPCFIEFVFEVPYNGCSGVSPLYQIRIGRRPPDCHATSFECFLFFFPVTLHLIVPPCTMKNLVRQEMSFGRLPTVIPSFMTATLYLSPNFSLSGSGCIVSFSPTVDPVDNDSLE